MFWFGVVAYFVMGFFITLYLGLNIGFIAQLIFIPFFICGAAMVGTIAGRHMTDRE